MQEAKQLHQVLQFGFDLSLALLFEPSGELTVQVDGDVSRRLFVLIDELLEGHVSGLLDVKVVVERERDDIFHLALQYKQLFRELLGVLCNVWIRHDLLAVVLNVRLHPFVYRLYAFFNLREDLENELQLLLRLVQEHLVHPLVRHLLGVRLDHLLHKYFLDFFFRLLRKHEVRVAVFECQVLVCLLDELVEPHRVEPLIGGYLVVDPGVLQKVLDELVFEERDILRANP